jgi:branched-chain amino acid transport system substrate-binding protein
VTIANTFASDRSLVAVVGHLNSGVTIPASKIYNQAKIAMISPAATNPALTLQGLNNIFRVCTIDSVQGPTGADAAFKEFGAKKVVVLDDSTPYGEGLASEFAKQFAANGGEVLFTEKTSDKDTDFNALVTKIKAAGPDLVYYGCTYNTGALLSKQMSESGVTAPLMGGDGLFDAQYIKLAGTDAAQGDLVTSVGLPTDKLPKAQEFTAAYKKQFPDKEIGAYDAYSYDAANVLIGAIMKAVKDKGASAVASPASRDEIIANVAATSVDGVTGQIAFDKNGDTTNKAITVYKVENGKWVAALIPGQ